MTTHTPTYTTESNLQSVIWPWVVESNYKPDSSIHLSDYKPDSPPPTPPHPPIESPIWGFHTHRAPCLRKREKIRFRKFWENKQKTTNEQQKWSRDNVDSYLSTNMTLIRLTVSEKKRFTEDDGQATTTAENEYPRHDNKSVHTAQQS